VNTINGNQIYTITIIDDQYYLYRDKMDYLLLLNYSVYPHIIKFEDSIDDLNDFEIEGIKGILMSQNNMDEQLKNMRIKLYDFNKIIGSTRDEIDLTNAKRRIEQLNKMLKEKKGCNDLTIELNYYHSINLPNSELTEYNITFQSLILCLSNREGCVSFIILNESDINDGNLEIDSETYTRHENKKYNKLLRCVIIIISEFLYPNIEKITSHAINPISAYLLIKYFNGTIYPNINNKLFFKFLEQENIDINDVEDYKELFEEFKKEYTKKYSKKYGASFFLEVTVDINPPNVQNAIDRFPEIIEEIIC
jgi:hypothetical protein